MRKHRKRRLADWVTEQSWLAEGDRQRLVNQLKELNRCCFPGTSTRKCCLLEIAYARRVMHLLPEDFCRQAVELAASGVENPSICNTDSYTTIVAEAIRRQFEPPHTYTPQKLLLETACGLVIELLRLKPDLRFLGSSAICVVNLTHREAAAENAAQIELTHDIFGNPFRLVPFSPSWRTDTAISLARQMYESREFSAMPILADALQDAGCDNTDILNHCRDTAQVHVRGCWVVDLVLGKK